MKPIEYIDRIYANGLEHQTKIERTNLRGMYKGEDRPEYLKRLIVNAGFFSKIAPEDTSAIATRNFIIDIMDDMGFLDEENLIRIVEFMLYELPVLPDRKRD